jgi:hypothetical protein
VTPCVVCGAEVAGGVHPRCLAERLPYDTAIALIATAALFLVPFIRVWSA